MEKRLQFILNRFLCLLLCVVMSSMVVLNVCAAEVKHEISPVLSDETLYIKDVQLIYADSLENAKKILPEGYQLLENDLNKGTDSDNKVYFIYSTTTDPDEAVTSIKMMNMKGGYVMSDYEEQLRDVKESVRDLANDVRIAAEMFDVNYKKGTYGAKAAYRALSAFTVDEAGGMSLADYIIYKNPSEEFYIKFVLNAHQDVLSAVISALAMAVQGEPGNTWLDRLVYEIEDPFYVDEEPSYWNDSGVIWEHFYGFYEVYNTIDHSLYKPASSKNPGGSGDNNDNPPPTPDPVDPDAQTEVENNGIEALYEVAYMTLESYQFQTGETFSEWFLGDDVFVEGEELLENFFPILAVMTPEELAMLKLCGPLYMILATGMDEEAYEDYIDRIEEITGGESACSIWAGVNSELFKASIGITDEAARKIAETEFERELNNEADSTAISGLKMAGLIVGCGAVTLGVGLATHLAFGTFIMATFFNGTALSAAATAVATAGAIFSSIAITLGIVGVVIAIVVAIVYLVVWIVEICNEKHPEYTEIPEFMYDYVEDGAGNNQFILYESVKFQDGRVADVNTWEGKEWHAMYVSRDKAAGAPIEADVLVTYGDGSIKEGYAGLSNFGNQNAQNLNGYAFDDDVNGIFITYRQEDLKGDYARKDYLSHVKLFGDENADKAKDRLSNEGYTLYEMNLTPDSGYVTYLGYKTTNSESRALKDIRLAYGYNSMKYSTGGSDSSYGASGSTGDGMLTLYTTSISLFGTPIRSDFLILNDRNDAPAGYEPVNLFSGGPAINLNLRDDTFIDSDARFYLYFLPSETYTSGTQYLGGLTVAYDVPAGAKLNSLNSITKTSNVHGYSVLYTSKGDQSTEAALLYTTTYNPYRAIYNVTASTSGGEMGNAFSQTIAYDGVCYSLVTRYIVTAQEKVRFDGTNVYEGESRLYVAGIYSGGTPMRASDIHASGKQNGAPGDDFIAVSARLSDDNRAVNLTGGLKLFWQDPNTSINGGVVNVIRQISPGPIYLFVKGEEYVEGNYVTDLFIASKEDILYSSESDIDCDDLDNSYILDQLGALGAHNAILKNLNLEDSDNVTFIGYNKRAKEAGSTTLLKPITDIVLYYVRETDAKPASTMKFDNIEYKLVGNINLFCEEDESDSKCDRVYLYYTTNPAAGSPILDIKLDNTPILNGWETARTQNNKALSSDMDEYYGSMWFIHMKRTTEDPKYISEIVVGIGGSEAKAKAELVSAGCDYIVEKDLNNGVGAHSDYIYIGYKRTSNPNEAIRDLRTTHDHEVDSFVKNGVTYYKIEGNLNSYTNIFADDIFLYYTKDAKAGTPITSLGTSQHVANWSHGEGNRYVVTTVLNQKDKGSDLNANCGHQSDYIYLLQTRDRQDAKGAASMIGGGSVAIIVAFAFVSVAAIAGIYFVQKKRRVGVTTVGVKIIDNGNSADHAEGDDSE